LSANFGLSQGVKIVNNIAKQNSKAVRLDNWSAVRNEKPNSLKYFSHQQQNIFNRNCNETKGRIRISCKVATELRTGNL
jgi:hypothetical protein